jgi:tripartite-type tricarboxylate transporter receptor subunit TctC
MSWRLLGALAGAALACASASAQGTFPSAPVHILVPYPPGGAVDIIARTLGDELGRQWGQSIIIENRPGAGGVIASQALVKSQADGYTLILVAAGHALNPYFYSRMPYGFEDFTPITLIGSSPNILLVPASSPFKTLADMLAEARAKPGQISYGHAGNGTSPHLAGELLKALAKVDIAAVPYKGGAPSLSDLMGGHIPMTFNNIPESIAQIRAGTVRPLGVTTATRSTVLPDVPTIAEQGYPGFESVGWIGLCAPAKTPAPILDKLNAEVHKMLDSPETKAKFQALAFVAAGDSREQFAQWLKSELAKWSKVAKDSGAKAD